MWKYELCYAGEILVDSMNLFTGVYETEEAALNDGEFEKEQQMAQWELDGTDYNESLFDLIVTEV